MMGVADSFVPQTGYDAFTIIAKLYQGGTLVDEAQMRYDCKSIDPKTCLPQSEKAAPGGSFSSPLLIGGIVLVLLIAAGAWVWRRRGAAAL
jgi:hypothetical protein